MRQTTDRWSIIACTGEWPSRSVVSRDGAPDAIHAAKPYSQERREISSAVVGSARVTSAPLPNGQFRWQRPALTGPRRKVPMSCS